MGWILKTHRCELPSAFLIAQEGTGTGSTWLCQDEIEREDFSREICNRLWQLQGDYSWNEIFDKDSLE